MADDMDDELAKAIQASLEETSSVADTEEARFEAELQAAIEESKKALEAQAPAAPSKQAAETAPGPVPFAATSFLSQRAQDERARLERLKRRRPDLEPTTRPAQEDSDDEIVEIEPPSAKRQHISSSSRGVARRANAYASASSSNPIPGPSTASNSGLRRANASPSNDGSGFFWDGELRQTANAHVEPRKDTRPLFRLTNILAPNAEIEFAIVSAFCWNYAWVYQMFSRNTPVIAVDHSATGDVSIKAILPNWVRTTPFLRNGFGCMHMKFMLLFYKTGRLRVVVSTANLVDYDWRDIENSVWVQDVPKRAEPITTLAKSDKEDFPSTMVRVLHALNVAPALVNMLRNDHPNLPLQRLEDLRTHWDFSRVKAALVPSIAGKHEGWPKVILTGHTRLMKSLIDMGAATPQGKELVLECQGSSIGSYSSTWMNEFYRSARGESTQSWLDMPKGRRAKVPYPPVKILFPTTQYVRESVLGEAGGGTMFCRRKQWEATNFPRDLFHQSRSKRGRVLMHSKMILATFRDKRGTLDNQSRASTASQSQSSQEDDEYEDKDSLVGWLYMGSHNFTPSAWGTLSGSGFTPTLNVTNYELGIVIPLRTQAEVDKLTCWERLPPKYVLGRDEPWMQTESAAFVEDA
ncbi:phospholipase D/nuclease [Trametes coccinea BRFM310]|uniref:Phospholipase D/nuclease n=1 Tax=Trametes coccinea (strain BRFM310) TaxID=1353009 RepID=A0A1Y2IHR5_TRAC3|nr:phospholipase D/nuclease [Trametes coccinea BRFM310]